MLYHRLVLVHCAHELTLPAKPVEIARQRCSTFRDVYDGKENKFFSDDGVQISQPNIITSLLKSFYFRGPLIEHEGVAE